MLNKLKNFKWGYLLLTILLAAAGVCFIIFRETLSTIALIMGIILAIFGIVFAVVTIADKKRGVSFAMKIVLSVIALSCGIITIVVHKSDAVEWLVALFGLLLIIDGSFKLHTSAMSKRYRSVGWWLVLIPAVLVIIGGFISIRFRVTGSGEEEQLEQQAIISAVLGVTMIIDAVANLLSAFYVTSYESKMKKQVIKEYTDSLKEDENTAEANAEAPAEESTEAPAEESTEAPAEESTEAPAEESTEAPAEESTEAPAEGNAEAPAEENADAPAVENAEAPAEESTEAPAEENAEAPAEENTEAPVEENAEAPAEEKPAKLSRRERKKAKKNK